MITDRSWNQIQAALQFWLETARSSRIPPHMHPRVRPFFENGRPTPLTSDEIETVINSDPVADTCLGYPIRAIAEVTGLSPGRIRTGLFRHQFESTGKIGNIPLWPWELLKHVTDDLLIRDRVFRKRYAKSMATTSNPTTGDQPA